ALELRDDPGCSIETRITQCVPFRREPCNLHIEIAQISRRVRDSLQSLACTFPKRVIETWSVHVNPRPQPPECHTKIMNRLRVSPGDLLVRVRDVVERAKRHEASRALRTIGAGIPVESWRHSTVSQSNDTVFPARA